uniref:Glycerol-3-phosphate dehydrogenase [NAD(+)] n=1 Tax=Glossina morsitans morsitans TaxID=37546 RepID=A0A1B0G9C4_GLOMM
MEKVSICMVGSGNWGTAVAKVVAENAIRLEDVENRVNLFVYDEIFEGKRLSETINQHHINSKYLPYVKLPENLVAFTDLVESAKYADIIVFAIPSKHIIDFCKTLLGKVKPNALAVSLIKGFLPSEGGIELISHTITKYLKVPCAVLVGVNLASEIVANKFCEATLGCRDTKQTRILKEIFKGPSLRIVVVDDADCVEVCGLLKHILAFGTGLLDGLDCNENIRSALIRFGLLEMMHFIDIFFPGSKLGSFFESSGISDLITVCYGSRNRRIAEAYIRTDYTIEQLEGELLKGQKLLGPMVAKEVNHMLNNKGVEAKCGNFFNMELRTKTPDMRLQEYSNDDLNCAQCPSDCLDDELLNVDIPSGAMDNQPYLNE